MSKKEFKLLRVVRLGGIKQAQKARKYDANTAVTSKVAKHFAKMKLCSKHTEKQASKLAEQTPAKAHGNAPADLPGPPPPPPDPGEMAALA